MKLYFGNTTTTATTILLLGLLGILFGIGQMFNFGDGAVCFLHSMTC